MIMCGFPNEVEGANEQSCPAAWRPCWKSSDGGREMNRTCCWHEKCSRAIVRNAGGKCNLFVKSANFILLMFSVLGRTKGLQYAAPEDCQWSVIHAGESDVSLRCQVQAINTLSQNMNFSLIQTDHTVTLQITCDELFFESHLPPGSFAHLKYLKVLHIEHCKLPELPADTLLGLTSLRNFTLRTHNDDWGSLSLSVHSHALLPLKHLEVMDLGYNNMNNLPENILCPLGSLKVLNLTHNNLFDLRSLGSVDQSGHPCLPELRELDLSFNKIKQLSERVLAPFKNLQVLYLHNNLLKEVGEISLTALTKLQTLNFANNQLSSIPAQLFRQSDDLRELYLQNNSLSVLPSSLFNGLSQLLILNLSHNAIGSDRLTPDSFVDLIRLVILDISYNQIRIINQSVFQSQYSLQMLYLDHNFIDAIADNSFSPLYNLHTLVLNNNQLKQIDAFTFNGLYVLNYLDLDENIIDDIHQAAFKNCSSFQGLQLRKNHLTTIPEALLPLSFLRHVDLRDNAIDDIRNDSLLGLKQLHTLLLAGNNIGNLSRGTFREMASLKILDLSNNNIHTLEHGIFEDTPSLQEIHLHGNYLADINALFMNLHNLQIVNVSRNRLAWFDYALIPLELQQLDIHHNEIEVLGNYFELEETLQLRWLDASHNKIQELNAASFPNRIEVLRFAHNRIKLIHPFTFLESPNLRFVDLTNNSLENLDINALRLKPHTAEQLLPEFQIASNPYFCDCTMEWLQRINNLDETRQYPLIVDLEKVVCQLPFTRFNAFLPLTQANSSDFLCKYKSHCFALCHCCEFDACDCEMVCPENCTCYADQTWNTNIVDCSARGYTAMPTRIPMDVTELYLDGNDIAVLTSHTFIGRKNLKVLYLNNSNVVTIHNRTFNGLPFLQILHLENNKISALHGFEFETLSQLRELHLHNNHISSVSNVTFLGLRSIENLHLDHNFISDFQVWNLNYNTKLTHLYLSHNSWTCNCEYMEDFQDWLQSFANIIRDSNTIRCHYNDTIGPYLWEFNSTSCANYTSMTYLPTVFVQNYISAMIIGPSLVVLLVFLSVIGCVYRREMKVWVFSKYGVRLFHKSRYAAENEKLFDAFVSYCKKDESFVAQILAPELEGGSPSYRLCLRYRDLPTASYVAEAITEAIECSHRTIVVLSEQFLKSEWCRFELKAAHHESQCNHQHRLIVVVLDKNYSKDVDSDSRQCLRSASFIPWGDKRFWEKLRYAMPVGRGHRKPMNCPEVRASAEFKRAVEANSAVKLV